MNAEKVETMFDGIQKAFTSEIENLKNNLVKEFDASEKLKEVNQEGELNRRKLVDENENLKSREKDLHSELAIAKKEIEDKEKLIKVLDPKGVGQRLIHCFTDEKTEKLSKRIAELESKEKDSLETIKKLELERAEQVKTIHELRTYVSALKTNKKFLSNQLFSLEQRIKRKRKQYPI